MFCYNCGIKLDDKARFCPNCGTKVAAENNDPATEPVTDHVAETAAEPVAESVSVPEPGTVVPAVTPSVAPAVAAKPIVVPTLPHETAEYVPSVEEKTKACVKKTFSSAFFLIATILFTLSVIFSTVSFFITYNEDSYDYYEEPGVFDRVSAPEYESEDSTLDDLGDIFLALQLFDESLIWIIGLFITVVLARSKNAMKTGGITTLKVASCIKIGFSFIFALFLFMGGIAVCGFSEDSAVTVATLFFVTPIFIAVGVMYVIFSFKLSSGISTLRSIASTGIPTAKLSGLIGVVLFAVAAVNLLVVSGNVTIAGVTDTSNWADLLYALTKGVSCLLFGISFFNLKKSLKSLTEEYKLTNTPAAAG